jgi:hypothetical protein
MICIYRMIGEMTKKPQGNIPCGGVFKSGYVGRLGVYSAASPEPVTDVPPW